MSPLWCPTSSQDPPRHSQDNMGFLTPFLLLHAKILLSLKVQGRAQKCRCLGRCLTWLSSPLLCTEHVLPRKSRGSGLYPGWVQKFSLVHVLTAVTNSLWLLQRIDSQMGAFVLTFLALQGLASRLSLWCCHRLVSSCISSSPHYPLLPLHAAQCRFWHCQALLHGTHVKASHMAFSISHYFLLRTVSPDWFYFHAGCLKQSSGTLLHRTANPPGHC